MQFKQAIVRIPSKSLVNGLTTSSDLGPVDYEKACQQHQRYIETLEQCGLEVTVLEALESFPDSCFVEDPAILTTKIAICARPGAPSRQGEVTYIEPVLRRFYKDKITHIDAPGFLDGGDIMQIDHHFYIGLSKRTNQHGAEQFAKILADHHFSSSIVEFENILHLKTGISYLANNHVLISHALLDCPHFSNYEKIVVEEDEAYAANSIMVNDVCIMPEGFPKTRDAVLNKGFKVLSVDVSEFRKIDGGLSCLSLRF